MELEEVSDHIPFYMEINRRCMKIRSNRDPVESTVSAERIEEKMKEETPCIWRRLHPGGVQGSKEESDDVQETTTRGVIRNPSA